MYSTGEPVIFWCAIIIQVIGLVSVVLARVAERGCAQRCLQRVCYACFFAVGVSAMMAVRCGSTCWLPFAVTLSLMAVGATLDFRRSSVAAGH